MICQRCRTHLLRLQFQQHVGASSSSCARLSPLVRSQVRLYSDGPTPPPPTPRQPPTTKRPVSIPTPTPSATPGGSQPSSTEGAQSAANPEKPTKPAVERPLSSCPAGTKLQGLNYMKNKPDIFAMEDSEYPDWLWTLLDDPKKQSNSESGGVDLSTMNKKQRKRYEKKMAALAATQPPKIPLHEQAVDITPAPYNRSDADAPKDIVAEAAESLEKRAEITKSAREARRKGIRESNFLRGL
ncbi:hypothetical protein VTN77DRAFT_2145 [Rasamsonia byssochlamydoides]|uniref:mitochondrial 54S ribosomal protein mL54 n=1 Tax=Rasamsonia byssochlamydoides TaxID=89139 RepID=UPI003742A2BD